MEHENTSRLPDLISRDTGNNAEKNCHIATSSPPVASALAEDWFAWLQVLGAFSLNLNTW